jgi:hypothetical protein
MFSRRRARRKVREDGTDPAFRWHTGQTGRRGRRCTSAYRAACPFSRQRRMTGGAVGGSRASGYSGNPHGLNRATARSAREMRWEAANRTRASGILLSTSKRFVFSLHSPWMAGEHSRFADAQTDKNTQPLLCRQGSKTSHASRS